MSMESKKSDKPEPTTIAKLVETSDEVLPKAAIIAVEPAFKNKRSDVSDSLRPHEVSSKPTDKSQYVYLLDRLKAENMLVPGSNLGREIQDDYRRIKRPLVSNAVGRDKSMVENGNLILVTSSIPGEGKTYTSVNLALSISQEMDTTVLLVDCDVAKQGVSRMLGLEKICGLVDVLESDYLTIGDVMLQTDIPNFRVVSAGKQNEYYAELLTSQRMSDLVSEITSRYPDRIIIFDGPPLLPTPQTQILAGLVGQVVFVIEAGKTPQSLVQEALQMIPEEQAIGLLMNKNEGVTGSGSYYGYYGYYGDEDEK